MWGILHIVIHTIMFIGELVKTIQMTIDEPLLVKVDYTIKELNMTRSAFIREALELALRYYQILEMERQHAKGYAQQPVEPNEFDIWQNEQAWDQA